MSRKSRRDLHIAATAGDYGKPRPVLIIRDNAFDGLDSLTCLPLTSDLQDTPLVRIAVEPTRGNGLREPSQIMVDKPATLPRRKVGRHIGRIDDDTMRQVDHALARFLGLERE